MNPANSILAQSTLPAAFQKKLKWLIPDPEAVQWLEYVPDLKASGFHWPESLLALTDDSWCLITKHDNQTLESLQVSYADTVLVERTSILLYGQLRIDYVDAGRTHSMTLDYDNNEPCRFNEAAHRLVSHIESVPFTGPCVTSETDRFQHWPRKFHKAANECLPANHHLISAVTWPAVRSGVRRELFPAATLIITEHEFLLLSEDRTWSTHVWSMPQRHGVVATYFPRVCVAQTRLSRHERFDILSVELHASHGGEAVEIAFPKSAEADVKEALIAVS